MPEERTGLVTFQGNPLTLMGAPLKVGVTAPPFKLLDNTLQPVGLADSAGKIRLLTVVPSLDTPVCDTMTRNFNQQAAKFPDDVVVYTVSVDLPFAQARWCGNAGIDKVQTTFRLSGPFFRSRLRSADQGAQASGAGGHGYRS